jgi:hypothetical protein
MTLPNIEHLDIDKMSIEDIDNLIPQLDEAMEELKSRKPIHEVVSDKFSECWPPIEEELTNEFQGTLEEEKEQFLFNHGFKLVLEKSIGEEHTNEFLRVLKVCLRKKNFRANARFYRKVNNPEVSKVAQVGFAVYRLHLSSKKSDKFIGGNWIKGEISELKRDESPAAQAAIRDFTEIGLI